MKLMSVQEVADLLQISPKSVYKHALALGGFHPAGVRCLRFHPEVIHDCLQRQAEGSLTEIYLHSLDETHRQIIDAATKSLGKVPRTYKKEATSGDVTS